MQSSHALDSRGRPNEARFDASHLTTVEHHGGFPRRCRFAIACLLVLTGGCAMSKGTPDMPAAKVAMAKPVDFTPAQGKVGIYVIRPFMILGGAVPWEVWLDAEHFGSVRIKQYIYAEVPPGEHTMGAIIDRNFTVQTEPGKNYFFLVLASPSTGNLQALSDEEGRNYVNDSR
jgi:hypothetical protein